MLSKNAVSAPLTLLRKASCKSCLIAPAKHKSLAGKWKGKCAATGVALLVSGVRVAPYTGPNWTKPSVDIRFYATKAHRTAVKKTKRKKSSKKSASMPSIFPYVSACEQEQLAMLKSLYEQQKLDVTQRDVSGATVAHLAALFGHFDVLQWLHSVDMLDVRATFLGKFTLSQFAVVKGNLRLVQWLHSVNKLFPLEGLERGGSAMHWASFSGHADILDWLLSLEEVTRLSEEESKMMKFTLAHSFATGFASLEMLNWLHARHLVDPKWYNQEGWTMAHCAARCARVDVMQWLELHGMLDAQARSADGFTIGHICLSGLTRECTSDECIEMLEWLDERRLLQPSARCAVFDAPISHWAAMGGYLDILKWLHSREYVDWHATCKGGIDILKLALFSKNSDVVSWVIHHHPDLNRLEPTELLAKSRYGSKEKQVQQEAKNEK